MTRSVGVTDAVREGPRQVQLRVAQHPLPSTRRILRLRAGAFRCHEDPMGTRTVFMALLSATVVLAQTGDGPQTCEQEYRRLAGDWQAATASHNAALQTLMASEAWQKASAAEDTEQLAELRASVVKPDAKAFGERALRLADRFAGDEALRFLTFACDNLMDKATIEAVVERLLAQHTKSANLDAVLENAMILQSFVGKEQAEALLARVVADNEHALPKAWAMYWQAIVVQRDKAASDEQKRLAATMLTTAEQLAAGTVLADRIAGPRFMAERLQIGMAAPDIQGEDMDGVPFRLSDYRGQVVVLDFWGFW